MLSSIPVGAARRDPVAAGAWLWLCGALAGACGAGAIGCAESAPAAPARGARVASTAHAASAASTAPAASSVPAAAPAPAGALPVAPPAERERSGDASPRERWVGTLELTKGAQPLIAGRILSREDAERWLGPDWRSLTGQRVRVMAVLRDHVCEPHAQCMTGGRIPLLEQVASVEVCSGAEAAGRTDVVDCAPSPAQAARCEAECRSLSDGCDQRAGDRGALRRCGCAKISCERGCEETGEPLFACR
ncbi:hypothetical protein WMF26_14180 [Sorangium sp. So ce185]|uniref:hypothetical protein n=1 Tax=Sorangium sp. So ce185 TaxID=3133287 RepID=UPI003F62431E